MKKAFHDPFAMSLAMVRLSGYAIATQMRCATVLARSAMDFATLRPWLPAAEKALTTPRAPDAQPRPAARRKPVARKKPAPKPAEVAAVPMKPRLVASTEAPAKPKRQPAAPPAMAERAATGTGEA